ncbi:MAG: SMP-30/gluconolactonase/LRE family protein [Prevotella sp.]|nr:SMP-30/gluconolactonase/LRE family protein [Prevotella sp.]
MTYKSYFLILALLLCTTIARAQYNQVNDIPYRDAAEGYAQERCKLDVYYPTNETDAPVVVWFHGGGIEGGEKHIDPQLKNSGLVVVAANYRLLPKAPIDDILDDAAAAVAWTYKNIAKYNGSKRKIFVAGHSAGGYLLDMIGLDKRWLAKYGVDADSLAALVPFSGQCVTHYNIRKQQGIPPLQATIDQYAPLTYVRADAPPIIIISGDRELELFGRYEEQAYFWRMLKLVGHKDVTLYEMQGYDHGAMPFPAYKILKDHIKRLTEKKSHSNEIVAEGEAPVRLADSYSFTEGPATDARGNVYFTDQPNNRIYRWDCESGEITLFTDQSGRSNGMYFDAQGNLIACADMDNQLWRFDMRSTSGRLLPQGRKNGQAEILITDYRGKLLNGPNDVWISKDGGYYLTDPYFKRDYWTRSPERQQPVEGLYYLAPGSKQLLMLDSTLNQPNGIVGTPDGKHLYVAEAKENRILRYDILTDGSLTNRQVFANMGSDGMTIDDRGNIYLTGDGVTVFNKDGQKIAHFPIPEDWTANVCFGGKEHNILFITASKSVYTLKMLVHGVK